MKDCSDVENPTKTTSSLEKYDTLGEKCDRDKEQNESYTVHRGEREMCKELILYKKQKEQIWRTVVLRRWLQGGYQ